MSQFVYGKNVVKQILMDDASKCQMLWLAGNDREMEAMAQRYHGCTYGRPRSITILTNGE